MFIALCVFAVSNLCDTEGAAVMKSNAQQIIESIAPEGIYFILFFKLNVAEKKMCCAFK